MCAHLCCGQSKFSGTHVFILRNEKWGTLSNAPFSSPSPPSNVLDIEGVSLLACNILQLFLQCVIEYIWKKGGKIRGFKDIRLLPQTDPVQT